jgi:hypothetical protein
MPSTHREGSLNSPQSDFSYSVYGLHVQSTQSIPGLLNTNQTERPDVRIRVGELPYQRGARPATKGAVLYSSNRFDERGEPNLIVTKLLDAGLYEFHYSDGIEFFIDDSGSRIWADWPETMTLADMATYLLGPVLGFVLRLRGVTSLHASAISIDGCAIAFVGAQGIGKSTLAAAFARWGYPILADDVVALWYSQKIFLVQPAYPRVRLWPSSVSALYGSVDALPLLTPNWNKRYVDLTETGYKFQTRPLPLTAIYLLGRQERDSPATSTENPLATNDLIQLITNAYGNYLLDKEMRAAEFETLKKLVAQVPIRRVRRQKAQSSVYELCQTILDDFAKLPAKIDA